MTAAPERDAKSPAGVVAEVVAAINERDVDLLGGLLGAKAEVHTGRSVHSGAEAIVAWAQKEYDHLRRVYAIDEYRLGGGGTVLAVGCVQYVWTEGGEVADSSPIALLAEVSEGALDRLTVHDDVRAALSDFDRSTGG